MLDVCEQYPDLIALLRSHLPRSRLLRACLNLAYAHGERPPPTKISKREIDRDLVVAAWYSLAKLQQLCVVRGQCQARGCTESGRMYRCKGCFNMLYCGAGCQARCVSLLIHLRDSKDAHCLTNIDNFLLLFTVSACRDWKEHKLVCGFLLHPSSRSSGTIFSVRLPFRFRQIGRAT